MIYLVSVSCRINFVLRDLTYLLHKSEVYLGGNSATDENVKTNKNKKKSNNNNNREVADTVDTKLTASASILATSSDTSSYRE